MADTNGVIWAWSIANSENTLFIFRNKGREVEVDLRFYIAGSDKIGNIFLFRKEREVLTKLKKYHN